MYICYHKKLRFLILVLRDLGEVLVVKNSGGEVMEKRFKKQKHQTPVWVNL